MSTLPAIVLATAACAGADAGDPFAAAAVVPPDVRLYLDVQGAAGLRRELAGLPVAQWAGSWLARGQLPQAWNALAEAAGADGAGFFDACLGRRVTILVRGADEPPEWAVLTEIESSGDLLERLSPLVLGPKHNVGIFHLPEQELLVARAEGRLLIAPEQRPGLFHEVAGNLARLPAESLAGDPAFAEARRLGPGRAGIFVRHAQPLGGWSAAVADVDGDRVRIRHASRFDHSPFQSDVTRLEWDPSPLGSLVERMILGFIEPTDNAGGRFDSFLMAMLGQPLIPSALGDNLGGRRITVLSDLEGRLQEPPFDLLLPTVARVYEVNDAATAWRQIDEHMVNLIDALNRLGQGAFHLEPPDPAAFRPGEPRSIEIGPVVRWLLGDVPGAGRVTLNWTVVGGDEDACGPQGCWCVVASDPEHLNKVADALASLPQKETSLGRWTNCGVADGPRLAQHLGTWRDRPGLLAAAEDEDALREALGLLQGLANGVDHCRWRLWRPTAECVRTEAELILSPAESAGP